MISSKTKLLKQGVRLNPEFIIKRRAKLSLEPPVALDGTFFMKGKIGAYTYIRAGSRMAGGVSEIGRYCSIAPNVYAGDGPHPTDWLSTHPFQWGDAQAISKENNEKARRLRPAKGKAPVKIGNDVWIGSNAIVLRGVELNHGCVVAAGSIVTKSVPPYAIVAGNPARIIRYRFDNITIRRLLELRWWRFKAEDLIGIDFNDVNVAIEQIRRMEGDVQLTPYQPQRLKLTLDALGVRTQARAAEI